MNILGLSFGYHDSAVALVVDGIPKYMAHEERFSREKHCSDFPSLSIEFVLNEAGISTKEIDRVVFYEKPFLKLERIMKTNLLSFPFGPRAFVESTRNLFTEKMWVRERISRELDIDANIVYFSEHHFSHMASTFFCSPYKESAIVTIDGIGEWTTTAIGFGGENGIEIIKEIRFPHSLGLFYSAFTAFLGFRVNNGEYKVMGMAPYGKPIYKKKVLEVIKLNDDGSYELDMDYFSFDRSVKRTYSKKFEKLFGVPRDPDSFFFTRDMGWPSYFGDKPPVGEYDFMVKEQERYADIASSVQCVLEDAVLGVVKEAHRLTGHSAICMAGGVALNSVANGRILKETPFDNLFIQPSSGDAGGALGSALGLSYSVGDVSVGNYVMSNSYYGNINKNKDIKTFLDNEGVSYVYYDDNELILRVSRAISCGKVVGWVRGRSEWGPRALGHRSILADPRRAEMKDIVNVKIKFREPYRPFAPSVLSEEAENFFEIPGGVEQYPARFMLLVVPVIKEMRDKIPAIVHIDGTARPQVVFKEQSPCYHSLISEFYKITGIPMVLNTSFNLKGEPIVDSCGDAYKTFMNSGIDILVLENYFVEKS